MVSTPFVPAAARPRARTRVGLRAGAAIIALALGAAVLSLVWTPWDPEAVNPAALLQAPSPAHWLGTDRFGRDIASALLVGARTTLLVGAAAVALSAVVGVPLGVCAAMAPSGVATILLRVNDVLLAFPAVLLAIIFAAAVGPGSASATAAVGIAGVPVFARVAHAATTSVLAREFVLAARSCGTSAAGIAIHHVSRHIGGTLVLQASLSFALAVLAEAALSFLGLGPAPPTPSWGRMLEESRDTIFFFPWTALWPGLAVAVVVLGFNLLGDGLRDLLDPASGDPVGRRST